MRISKSLIGLILLPLAIGVMVLTSGTAEATTECSVKMTGKTNTVNKPDSRWTMTPSGVATGTFKVTGDANCKQTVTIAAWEAPNVTDGRPYDQQKLVAHETKTFAVGTHKLSIKIPNCFYQLDMIRGADPKGIDGTALYKKGTLMGSLHGGTQKCEVPTPPVTPETPVTPQTPEVPQELPATGIGSNMAFTALAVAVLGTAFQYYRRLRTA